MNKEGEKDMILEKPEIEFVAIKNPVITVTSDCTDDAYQTGYQMCGCTNSSSAEEAQCSDGWVV